MGDLYNQIVDDIMRKRAELFTMLRAEVEPMTVPEFEEHSEETGHAYVKPLPGKPSDHDKPPMVVCLNCLDERIQQLQREQKEKDQ